MAVIKLEVQVDDKGAKAAIGEISKGLDNLATSQTGAIGTLGKALSALGPYGQAAAAGIGAAVTATGALALAAREAVAYGASLSDAAARTDMTVESIQRLTYIGSLGGVTFETIQNASKMMTQELAKSPKTFEALGLNVQQLKAMRPEDSFTAVAGALNALPEGFARTSMGINVFGKAWTSVAPLVKSDIAGMNADADMFGGTLSTEVVRGLDAIDDATTAAAASWAALKREAGLAFIEAMGGADDTAASIREMASAMAFLRTMVGELGANLARPEVQAFFAGARGFMGGGLTGAFAAAAGGGSGGPSTAGGQTDVMGKVRQDIAAANARLGAALAQAEKDATAAAKDYNKQLEERERRLDRIAGNAESEAARDAADSAAQAERDLQYLADEEAIRNRIDAEAEARNAEAASNADAATEEQIEDWQKIQAEEEEAARILAEKWVSALNVVSGILSQIDNKFADAGAKAAELGANIMSGNVAGAITSGFGLGQAIGGLFGWGDQEEREAEAQRLRDIEIAAAQAQADAANAAMRADEERRARIDDLSASLESMYDEAEKFKAQQLSEGMGGMAAMFASLGDGAEMTQERLDRLGRTGLALFNARLKEGVSYVQALEEMGPTLDAAMAAAQDSGLNLGGSFGALAQFRGKVTANQGLVEGAQGWGQVVEALRTTGSLDQATFADQMAEATARAQDLRAAGFSNEEAIRMLAPGLLQLQEQAGAKGWALDAGTQDLIDQANAMGAFDGLVDPMQQLAEINNRMLQALYQIVEIEGGILTADQEKWRAEIERTNADLVMSSQKAGMVMAAPAGQAGAQPQGAPQPIVIQVDGKTFAEISVDQLRKGGDFKAAIENIQSGRRV